MNERRKLAYLIASLAAVALVTIGAAAYVMRGAPLVKAAAVTASAALLVILLGGAIFRLKIDPLLRGMRQRRRQYRQLFDTAADMIFLRDPDSGNIMDVNLAACRLLGYRREELLWRSYFDLLASPEEVTEARRLFDEALRTGSATRVGAFLRKDGSRLEVEIRNTPMRIADKVWLLGIGRDLTAQRQLERQALAFYQGFRNSNDYMFYTDRNGIILDVNDAFIQRFGYKREEAVGRSPRIVRSQQTSQDLYKRLWRDILDPSKGFWRGRVVNRTKNGAEVPVILSITAVRDARGEIVGFVSNAVDVAEQERMQRLLAKSESLAAMGSMAAVVAHEIRNPLGSIVTAASSISHAELPAKERGTLLAVIRKESKRLNDTLNQFLQYARPRGLRLEKQDLNQSIREVLRMIRSDPKLLGKVRIEERLDKALPPFPFDGDQLRQVLWNVVMNALQAMGGKGLLAISTGMEEGEAVLRVSDTGPGVPEESRTKIFEPFHTTKQQGTGLGLAVAERIVSAHGGHILIESAPGSGARFSIVLPTDREG
ncbi:MAG: PAS domain S-box protein [Elusimicrobiota bacterium]